ncbi:MAG: hypothetical protein D6785_12240, partial [Planctomycetota bacterium]
GFISTNTILYSNNSRRNLWLRKLAYRLKQAKNDSEKAELLYWFGPPQNRKEAKFLLYYLLYPHGLVQACVIENLGKTSDNSARSLLRSLLSSKKEKVLLQALKIMQKLKDRKALPKLWKLLKVKKSNILMAVLDCLATMPHKKSIKLCIQLLKERKLPLQVKKRILFALFQMTGYAFETVWDWEKFWKLYGKTMNIGKVYDPCEGKRKTKEGFGKTVLKPQGYNQRFGTAKQALLKKYGGSRSSEQAVYFGLDWLKRHQDKDGKWSTAKFDVHCKGFRCKGFGKGNHDVALTGLALLAYLGAGHTHLRGPFKNTVKKGLFWLKKKQKKDGSFFNNMYDHGIATFAIAEAYILTQECWLRKILQKGVDFICKAQTKDSGWRYRPHALDADISVSGWQIMALDSARKSPEIHVPLKNLIWAAKFLDNLKDINNKGNFTGLTRYHLDSPQKVKEQNPTNPNKKPKPTGGSLATSAVGVYCRHLLGEPMDSSIIEKGIQYFAPKTPKKLYSNHPQFKAQNRYFWYYAFLALFQKGGMWWKKWNHILPPLLIKDQQKQGCAKGSFPPDLHWGHVGGRVYSTAISVLTLEVYYRYKKHN